VAENENLSESAFGEKKFHRRTMTRHDIWLRVAAGIIGGLVALLPSQYHSASANSAPANSWFSSYEHLSRAMWLPPWSFLSLAALGLWLYLSRFHRGNIGLALCTGIAIVKTIQTLH